MKFAFYPGCVARGAGPELFDSAVAVIGKTRHRVGRVDRCVLHRRGRPARERPETRRHPKHPYLGYGGTTRTASHDDMLDMPRRNGTGRPQSSSRCRLSGRDQRLPRGRGLVLQRQHHSEASACGYSSRTSESRTLKKTFVKELSGVNLAPFYGCYIVRPSDALGFDENPERQTSLETVIEAVGGNVIDFPGKTACCGFPILLINQRNSLRMVANHTGTASELGADAMVTPCPLCHLNLDGYQPKARRQNKRGKADLPIIHLPQLLGLAMGIDSKTLGLGKHLVNTRDIVHKVDSISVAS